MLAGVKPKADSSLARPEKPKLVYEDRDDVHDDHEPLGTKGDHVPSTSEKESADLPLKLHARDSTEAPVEYLGVYG